MCAVLQGRVTEWLSLATGVSVPAVELADTKVTCYEPASSADGDFSPLPDPALGDRLMVGLQTLTLPV